MTYDFDFKSVFKRFWFLIKSNKLCGRPPQDAPASHMTLPFDLLTSKMVSDSRVTWATSVPILGFLGLSVLDARCTRQTDRQTSDAHHRLTPLGMVIGDRLFVKKWFAETQVLYYCVLIYNFSYFDLNRLPFRDFDLICKSFLTYRLRFWFKYKKITDHSQYNALQ